MAALITCLCVSGMCACGLENQAKDKADTQVQTQMVDSENTEGAENIPVESSEEASQTREPVVISFDPASPQEYKGEQLQLAYTEEESLIKVTYGDAVYEIEDYIEWIDTGYMIAFDDSSFYTIIQACGANDWITSYILKYDGETFTEIAAQNGSVRDTTAIRSNQITFSTRVNVFGTYGVNIPMRLENDRLTPVDDFISFINEPDPEIYDSLDYPEAKAIYNKEGYSVLTLNHTLQAMSEDGVVEIEEGEQIIPDGYNEKDKKFYFTYQDKQYYFTYEEEEDGYTLTIDGVDQYDMFVYLPYAG